MTSFDVRLSQVAERLEPRLAALLEAQRTAAPGRLLEAMRHAVLGGGKRFRPFLVMESADLFGADPRAALEVAAALEFVHCYSLVHDDLPAMDNDELRRGRLTVWKAFDDWTAILAGDALLTLAFEVLGSSALNVGEEVRGGLIRRLARAAGPSGMVGGQALDLAADKLGEPKNPTAEQIWHLQSLKTGALIVFACEAGALLGGAGTADLAAMVAYGTALGRAFQLSDDLLDATGDAGIVGKAVAKDATAGKATLVGLLGEAAARAEAASLVETATAALSPYYPRAAGLIAAAEFMVIRQA